MAFVASSKGTNLAVTTADPQVTFNVPAGTSDNDLMVVAVYTSSGPGTFSTPAGWNNGGSNNFDGTSRLRYFYRAASSEPASYTFTWTITASATGRDIVAMCGTYNNFDAADLFVNDFLGEDIVNHNDLAGTHADVDFPTWGGAGTSLVTDIGRAPTFLIARGDETSGAPTEDHIGTWTLNGTYTVRESEAQDHATIGAFNMYYVDEDYTTLPAVNSDFDWTAIGGTPHITNVVGIRIFIETAYVSSDHWAWTTDTDQDSWQA